MSAPTFTLDEIEADLDAHLFEALELDAVDPGQLDDDAADRAMRALGRIDAEMDRWETLARQRKADIDEWLSDRLGGLLDRRDFWLRCLETYARANHEVTGAKSVNLPSGKVALRQTPPRIDTAGEPDESVPPALLRVVRAWDKRAVKEATKPGKVLEEYDGPADYVAHAAITDDGEILDGVVWLVRTEPTFDAKPNPIGGAR